VGREDQNAGSGKRTLNRLRHYRRTVDPESRATLHNPVRKELPTSLNTEDKLPFWQLQERIGLSRQLKPSTGLSQTGARHTVRVT
jgi:hypothetical protein